MKSRIDFAEQYTLFYKRLFLISLSITRDKYLAEDVVQETFIKAMKKADTIENEEKMGAWLSVIATRTAIDFLRRERNRGWIPMEREMLEGLGKETKGTVEQEVEHVFLLEQIHLAIKELTLEQQELLMLRLTNGLKETEIADFLQMNPCTVKTKIYRARKKLKLLVLDQRSA
jgi:RNA polymerase sigma factor (sigma-70 family)